MQSYISQPLLRKDMEALKAMASLQLSHVNKRKQSQDISSRYDNSADAGKNTKKIRIIRAIINNNHAEVFKQLTGIANSFIRRRQLANGFFIYKAMVSLCNFMALPDQKIQLLIAISEIYKQQSDFAKAEKMLRKALQYAWLIRNHQQELLIYDKLGIVHYTQGDVEKADYYHKRFAMSHLESQESPAYIVAMENVKNVWDLKLKMRSNCFTYDMLILSYLLSDNYRPEDEPPELTEEYLEDNIRLTTNDTFEQLSSAFLESDDFNDKIASIEPLQIQKKYQIQDSPSRRLIQKKMEAYEKVEKVRNHNKVALVVKQLKLGHEVKQKVVIPKCFNIHRMIEERIKDKKIPPFDQIYDQIKKKSLEVKRDDRKVNLPVLVSHRRTKMLKQQGLI